MCLFVSLVYFAFCGQIRLVEGRDRPIDRLAKNVLLYGEQDQGEGDVSLESIRKAVGCRFGR